MNNKKKGPNIFRIVLIVSGLLLIGQFFLASANGPKTVSVDELTTLIKDKEIANVNITPNSGIYVITANKVTKEQAQAIKDKEEKTKQEEEQLEAYNELVLNTQTAQLAGMTLEEQTKYIEEQNPNKKEVSENSIGFFNNLYTSLQGVNGSSSAPTPIKTIIVSQEFQIKEIIDLLNQEGTTYNIIPYKAPFDWGMILQIGMFVLAGFFLFNLMKGKAPGVENKDFLAKVPDIRFKDVIGYEEEKQELTELVDFLKRPDKYRKMGAKLPRGVLLEGPPGTGKTLMAKAVAGESGVPFYAVSGSDFEEMYVGLGASRIRKLFKEAKKNAPAIIFIDEIDAIGNRDNGKGNNPAQNQTINSLLVEMDGFESNQDIIVMAATNKKSNLDDALLRPGRFDRQILVDLPPVKTRKDILEYHLSKKQLSSHIDIDSLARSTTGMSGAQLAAVANEAAILAVRENKKEINQEMLQESIDRVLMGPAKITNKYTSRDKEIVSYHESGHCIVGLELEGAMEVQKITIIPRRDAGGYVSYIPSEEEERFTTKRQLLDRLASLLAGRCSEEIFIGKDDITIGAFNDFEQATNIARAMVTKYGMSDLGTYQFEANGAENLYANKQYSEQTAFRIDEEITRILSEAKQRAQEILIRRREDVILLAKTIREREVLDKEQIDYLMANRCLPQDMDSVYKASEIGVNNQDENNTDNINNKTNGANVEVKDNTPQEESKPTHRWPKSMDSDADNFM